VTIVSAREERQVARGPKSAVAAAVLDEVEALRTPASESTTLEERR
jgi:hypothetical protein